MKLIFHRISYFFLFIFLAAGTVDVFAQTAGVTPVAGRGVPGFSGDGGPAPNAQLNGPSGVSIDSAGNFYIADLNNNRVRKVTGAGTITTFVGDGAIGFWNFEGGPATPTLINHPADVAVAPDGANLYFTDFGEWSPIASTTLYYDDVLNTGPSRIHRVIIATHTIRQVPVPLTGAVAIALDSAGNLYISERHGQRIVKYIPSTGAYSTIAGTGTAGFSGDGGAATQAQLHNPAQVTVDAAGNVYFADSLNHRIRKIAAGSGIITTVAGSGAAGGDGTFSGDGGPATSAGLNHPQGIAVDAAGNLLIADTFNQRIRRVNAKTGIIKTMIARQDTGDCAIQIAPIDTPFSVETNPAGDFIYVADNSAHRVWKASVIPETSAPTLTSITPSGGAQGATVAVTLSGTGFNGGGCKDLGTTVSASGTGVTVSNENTASDTSLTATFNIATDAATGPRDIKVTTGGGTSSAVTFTVTSRAIPPPTLTSATPSTIGRGTTATVTLTGTNFDTAGNTTVTAEGGGLSISQVAVANATSLTAVLAVGPDASLGSHNLRVTTPGGASNPVSVSVTPEGPAFVYGLPPTLNPTMQAPLQVALAHVSSDAVTGTLTLTFTPNASTNKDDPNVMFVNSQTSTRTTTVTFPPNTATAQIALPDGLLQAGTVAGTIQLDVTGVQVGGVQTDPASSPFDVQVPRTVPVITNLRVLNRSAAGFDVEVTGYSTSRDMTTATFDFGAASGANLITVQLQPQVNGTFTSYYQSDVSSSVGGSFVYLQPFLIQQGDVKAVASVTVTLANSVGNSQPRSAAVQ